MEAPFLDIVLRTLFPKSAGTASPWNVPPSGEKEWHKELEVSEEELAGIIRRMRERNTGPIGVPSNSAL